MRNRTPRNFLQEIEDLRVLYKIIYIETQGSFIEYKNPRDLQQNKEDLEVFGRTQKTWRTAIEKNGNGILWPSSENRINKGLLQTRGLLLQKRSSIKKQKASGSSMRKRSPTSFLQKIEDNKSPLLKIYLEVFHCKQKTQMSSMANRRSCGLLQRIEGQAVFYIIQKTQRFCIKNRRPRGLLQKIEE